MTTDDRPDAPRTEHAVVVSRELDVPPDVAWTAWSDPDLLRRWWGPTGFTCPRADVDVRVGGSTVVTMQAPDEWGGFRIHNRWSFRVVQPPERLAFVSTFVDEAGTALTPGEAGVPATVPVEVPHVVLLEPLPDGRTRLTLTETGYVDEETRAQSQAGQEQCIDKMQAIFAAPDGTGRDAPHL
ncbi:SRPBCC family protein [Cellulomonas wangsupingiae]|uniref:SRPBCC domain-containing protein n=1 Tax=Cellulomonas wangsupingiae TaxID=2968085 RepID=A0ABY5K6X0_9CELL|nr:SRPBCC domain-containing protein [Cellulomonas wangsupingiae]MCC2335045.1 SRPBCC domain-containing protein [Cellulomonas wangsupingiae]UUI65544.1 SRPBCC domain-containing protein [Cellulomonas wangsupingiae]